MSIHLVKKQIDRFLSEETPEVMAIKGVWGVGKTFTWNKFLIEAKDGNRILLNKYSYVSLFGVNSLEAFKYSIFESVLDKKLIGTEASVETFKENTAGLLASLGRKSVKLVKGASLFKEFTPAIESLSFLSLNKTLICIDDLERKGANLAIKDVLGLVSQLKEQKKCKIVILLNDGEEGLEEYNKYREKAIDTELQFNPTSEECASIAYEGDSDIYKNLKEFAQKLDLKNIRILKKIERLVNLALPMTEDLEDAIRYQVSHSITLFTCCFYCHSEKIPSLDFVINRGYRYMGIGDEKVTDEEKRWNSLLGQYNYMHTDDFDLVLSEAVKTGYFDDERFKKAAQANNEQIIASNSQSSFSSAWNLYHDSFDDNKVEVIDSLYESFKKNAKYITPTNLNGTVTLLKELGENHKAKEIIDIYVNARKNKSETFNLNKINFFGDIKDPDIVTSFDQVYQASVTEESAEQVLSRISGRNGWNQSDEVVLSKTSVKEYFNLFKLKRSDELSSFIMTCLSFGNSSNASDQQKQITNNAKEALKMIGDESKINRLRVKKYGVDVDQS